MMLIFAAISSDVWIFVVSALLAWVIADTIFNLLIRGGEGIFQTRLAGTTHTQAVGYGYLVFLFVVGFATLMATKFTEWLMLIIPFWLNSYDGMTGAIINIANIRYVSASWFFSTLIISSAAGIAALIDLFVRFYQRHER
ncbi:MAG: hypothetical protein ABSA50_10465 [Candidatus Bathyarchaeia archaeon]